MHTGESAQNVTTNYWNVDVLIGSDEEIQPCSDIVNVLDSVARIRVIKAEGVQPCKSARRVSKAYQSHLCDECPARSRLATMVSTFCHFHNGDTGLVLCKRKSKYVLTIHTHSHARNTLVLTIGQSQTHMTYTHTCSRFKLFTDATSTPGRLRNALEMLLLSPKMTSGPLRRV